MRPQDLDIGSFLDGVQHAVVVVEVSTGRIVLWNPKAREVFGYSKAEALEIEAERLVPERQKASYRAELLRYRRAGNVPYPNPDAVLEVPAVRKGGEEIHIEVTLSPVEAKGATGAQCRYLMAIVRDVTERKRREEEVRRLNEELGERVAATGAKLRESEERFRLLVGSLKDYAIFIVDPDGRITDWNIGAERIFGYREEEIVGKNFSVVFVPEEVRQGVPEWELTQAVAAGRAEDERWHMRKDGSRFWASGILVPIRDEADNLRGFTKVARDLTERKLAADALQESEERLRATFEQAAVGMAHVAPDGRWLRVNQKLCEIAGYPREELLQMSWEEIVHPDDVEAALEQNGRLLVGEIDTYSMEQRHFRRDGSLVWVNLTVSLVRDLSGQPGYFIVVAEDVTGRKEAEAKYRTLVENVPAVTYIQKVVDPDSNRTSPTMYANPQIEAQVGYPPQAFEEDPELWIKLLHPDDRERVLSEDERTDRTGEPFTVEYRQFTRDGRVVWLRDQAALVRDEGGRPRFWQGVQLDITESKRAEENLASRTLQQAAVAELGLHALSNDDLQGLMDEAVDCVARTLGTEYCKIVELLPGGEELLLRAGVGWREGLVGSLTEGAGRDSQAGYTLFSSEPVILEDLEEETRFDPPPLLREHGVVSGVSVLIHGREGPFGVLGAHTSRRRTFTGDDANFLQAVANVLAAAIERKAAEEALEAVREAERSRIARDLHDEALRDLTYALAEAQHVHSISTDPRPVRRLGRLVAALKRAGQHLRGAIYDLRLEGEQDRPFFELLEALVDLHRAMSPGREIRLDVRGGVLSGPLGETGRELLRIIGEALTNARRHSEARNVRVTIRTSEDKLWAKVEDDGKGFDPAEHPSPVAGGGTGIRGMQERARALGGDLKIESEPGGGTKVRFEIALDKDRERPGEEAVRVLLVEDHASFREALASVFERQAAFEVVGQAASLAEARQVMENVLVDVAVVDLGLPDGYGGDLIKKLRETNPHSQALVLSANLDRAEIARAVESGAAGVLHKSAGMDDVIDAVRRLRAGEMLLPLEEVVELLRFAGSRKDEEYEARQVTALLTAREKEVLQALADGLVSQEIARRLQISVKTERNHVSSIMAKLRVHSRLQALVVALRHGVVRIR